MVALLRGINVGKSNRVKMADLTRVLEAFRVEGATSYLQSGNVLFNWGGSVSEARAVFDLVFGDMGLKSTAIIRNAIQMQSVATRKVFNGREEPEKLQFITFLNDSFDGKLQAGEASEILRRTPTEIYWVAHPREGKAPTGPKLPHDVLAQSTNRNWIVTRALAERLNQG